MKRIFTIGIMLTILAGVAVAGSEPTPIWSDGQKAYVYSLADGLTGDRAVAAGDSVETYGMSTQNIVVTNAAGTVTITPWFGYRVYDGSTLLSVQWVDGSAISCTSGSADLVSYPDLLPDLVRFAAASCSSCNYSITWKGTP